VHEANRQRVTINPLKTNGILLYLNTQSVPCITRFSSRL